MKDRGIDALEHEGKKKNAISRTTSGVLLCCVGSETFKDCSVDSATSAVLVLETAKRAISDTNRIENTLALGVPRAPCTPDPS